MRVTQAEIDGAGTVGVLIVDDQPPFRAVARTVVGVAPGFEVIGEAATGDEAVEMAARQHPDVILMDINLPGVNGIDATRQITDARPEAVVILLSSYDAASLPADAATCGAATYVNKEDFSPVVLREVWDGNRENP